MNKYQVIVGNIGTVVDTDSRAEADEAFCNHRNQGEAVILVMDGEVLAECGY